MLKTIWTTGSVEFQGKFYKVPKLIMQPKPVQKPNPPILMAAFVPKSLERTGKLADGWNPVGIPVDGMAPMFGGVKEAAKAAGPDPATLQMVVKTNLVVLEKPMGKDCWIFTGNVDDNQGRHRQLSKTGRPRALRRPFLWPGR